MTSEPIVESGMKFGPYPDGHCFPIETSRVYKNLGDGVKMAELLLIQAKAGKPITVWVVEAKSSSPRPNSQMPSTQFDNYIDDIRQKLSNALILCVAACLRRHPLAELELPVKFKELDLSNANFRFVLVIKGHKEAWLPPLQAALQNALISIVKTWGLPATSVLVINDELVVEHGLVADGAA